ncbi:MAG TPA: sugar ABC transporter substrate-binding protein [Nitrospirales bacterium]|nr:sugar ABC transporter substrate-binding protein [Nitrospirales bacterium]
MTTGWQKSEWNKAPAMWAVAVLMLGALFAGCTNGSGGDDILEIKFWAMGREGEIVPEVLKEFERENPGVRVIVQQIPWTSAHEKLLTAFAGDALPDVAQMGNTWIAEFAALDAVAGLDEMAEASSVIKEEDYFPGIWATNVVGHSLYGVPWYVDTRLLFYRQDILKASGIGRPPRDWAEWMQAATAVKEHVGKDNFAFYVPLNEYEMQVSLALQQGVPLLRDGDRYGNFSSPELVAALDFYLDFFRKGLAPPSSETDIANVWDEFARGHFTFYLTGPWNIGEFRRRLPADLQDKWMTAILPGPSGPGASTAGGSSLVVFKHSAHKDAAFRLVEFLSRPEIQQQFYEISGNLPPRRSSWRGERLESDRYVVAFKEQLELALPAPKIPEWERIVQELRMVTERAVHEKWTGAEVARELDSRIDRILEKRRWMLAREEEAKS